LAPAHGENGVSQLPDSARELAETKQSAIQVSRPMKNPAAASAAISGFPRFGVESRLHRFIFFSRLPVT
jgi:hypothetical protein